MVRSRLLAAALLVTEAALAQGTGGPSILSRGGNAAGRRGRAPVQFSFHAGVQGTYDSGLIAPEVTTEGQLRNTSLYGAAINWGLYGGRQWRNSSFGVDYRGDYRKSARRNTGFDGTNHALALSYDRTVGRRTTVFTEASGGVVNRAFGSFASPVVRLGPTRLGVPLDEIYDVQTYFFNGTGGASYRHSARVTFSGQVGVFGTSRGAANLVNARGLFSQGTAVYALSRRTQVGVAYQFSKFEFPRVYGGSDVHALNGIVMYQHGRNWSVRATGGVAMADTFGSRSVILSPEVAAVLGANRGVEAFQRTQYVPQVDIMATRTFERASFNAGYMHQVSAGNGTFQTSAGHSTFVGYSYTGIRKLSLGASAAYTRQRSLGVDLGSVETYRAGFGAGYTLITHLAATAQADWRRWNSPVITGRSGYTAMIGISYSTSRIPVSIW